MFDLIKFLKLVKHSSEAYFAKRYYGDPSFKLKVIGITGTNGKTTIATLLYELATRLGYKAGLISTVNILIQGKEYKTSRKMPTTPNSMLLNKILKEMVAEGCEYVFMEVTSHAAEQKRISGINFVGGVFSNLTHDHIGHHGSFENYFSAKKSFFEMLSENSFALSNTDDPYGKAMLKGIKAGTFSYGFSGGEYFNSKILKIDFSGITLAFKDKEVNSKLLGRFNAYNILAVLSAASLLNFDLTKTIQALRDIDSPRGRFEHFISKNGIHGIVDFAHSPDSLEKIILAIREVKISDGKLITVFGCGGDIDKEKRRMMGKIGATMSDIAIFTSDNPNTEEPEDVIDQMKVDLNEEDLKKVVCIIDRHEAILEAVALAEKGDIILCAGKGHEDYQEIKGVKQYFSDIEELKKALD